MTQKPEEIDYYDRDGKFLGTDLRKKVLAMQEKQSRETGDTDIVVNCVMLFLVNADGQVYVCKRAGNKAENPGLWDKTLGGHVVSGDSFDKTLEKELDEELGIDVEILKDSADSPECVKNTADITRKAVVAKVTEIQNYQSKRITKEGDSWNKRMNVGLYVGMYNGKVNFKDGEVEDSDLISINELESEIQKNPGMYTDDILKLIKEYSVLNIMLSYSRKVAEILKG